MIVLIIFIPLVMGLGMWYAHSLGHKQGLERGLIGRPVLPEPQKIECLCGHGPNFHKSGTGACDQTMEWHLQGFNDAFSYTKRDKCRCTQYVGPEYTPLTMDLLQLGK